MLVLSANFLNFTVTIEGSKIILRKYQKAMNLYLYLPFASAHPQGCIKCTVNSLIRRYYAQNSFREDYINIVTEQVMTWLSLVVTRSSSSYEGCYWLRPISHRTVLALGLAVVRPDHDRTYVVRTYYHQMTIVAEYVMMSQTSLQRTKLGRRMQ